MADIYRPYTGAERRKRAGLIVRGVRQALAGGVSARIEMGIDRIDATAEDRGAREADALYRQYNQAKDALASAKAAERAAGRPERPAARQAVAAAEQRVRDTARAIRRAGLA